MQLDGRPSGAQTARVRASFHGAGVPALPILTATDLVQAVVDEGATWIRLSEFRKARVRGLTG